MGHEVPVETGQAAAPELQSPVDLEKQAGPPRRLRRLRQWAKKKNQYGELGATYLSLEFVDKRTEDGFARRLTPRLATLSQMIGMLLLLVETLWIILFSDLTPEGFPTRAEHRTQIGCSIVDGLIGLMGLLLFVAGRVSTCSKRIGPRQVEMLVIVILVMILLLAPFTEMQYMARLMGSDPDGVIPLDSCESWFLLLIDCVVTCVNLMPIRWSSLWVLDILAIVWYPIVRGSVLGVISDGDKIITLAFLVSCAMLGKRSMEVHERRSFKEFLEERTMRVQSEFELARNTPQERTSTRTHTIGSHSLATEDIFQEGIRTRTIENTLAHVSAAAKREQWLIDPDEVSINISRVLGRGGFGAVVEGSMCGLPVAVKFSIRNVSDEGIKRVAGLIAEMRVLRKVRHPNIGMFYGAIIDPRMREVSLVLELVSGDDLHKFIMDSRQNREQLPDWGMFRVAVGVCRALQYLHGHRPVIVHGDLKPSNILVEMVCDMMPRAKLVDFGLSRLLSGKVRNIGGTVGWMAPELMKRSEPNTSVDAYGFGLVVQFMVSAMEPFPGMTIEQVKTALRDGELPTFDLPPDSTALTEVIFVIGEACIILRPSKRPSIDQVHEQLRGMRKLPQFADVFGDGSTTRDLWGSSDGEHLGAADSESDEKRMQWHEAVLHFQREFDRDAPPPRAPSGGGLQRHAAHVGGEARSEGGAAAAAAPAVGTEAPIAPTPKSAVLAAHTGFRLPPIGETSENSSSSSLNGGMRGRDDLAIPGGRLQGTGSGSVSGQPSGGQLSGGQPSSGNTEDSNALGNGLEVGGMEPSFQVLSVPTLILDL